MRAAPKIGILVGALGSVVAIGLWMAAAPQPHSAAPPVVAETRKPQAPIPVVQPPQPRSVALDASAPPTSSPPPAPKRAVAARPKSLTESELMEKLRKAQDTDEFVLSYDLAREGLRRFPDSADAPEMAAMVVKSLARQGKTSEARAEAETMVNKYAGTHWAREVERHTGAHPIRNQVPPP